MNRPLHVIAREISQDWQKVNYAAVPYLRAMHKMSDANEVYGSDAGIVLYFLSNAKAWRGPVARRIKAELKALTSS